MSASAALLCLLGVGITPPWTLEYKQSGGVHGRYKHVVVHDDGRVLVLDMLGNREADTQASPALLATLKDLLSKAFLMEPWPAAPRDRERGEPDSIDTIITGSMADGVVSPVGGVYLGDALESIYRDALQRADDKRYGPFSIGRVWRVLETQLDSLKGRYPDNCWDGTWIRRGDTAVFDAVWRKHGTGEERHSRVFLDLAQRGILKMHETPDGARYTATFLPTKQSHIIGNANRASGWCDWNVTIEQ